MGPWPTIDGRRLTRGSIGSILKKYEDEDDTQY